MFAPGISSYPKSPCLYLMPTDVWRGGRAHGCAPRGPRAAALVAAARRYPSDVDDPTWALIAPTLAQPAGRGRPRRHPDRLLYHAILYVLRGGIQWRMARAIRATP